MTIGIIYKPTIMKKFVLLSIGLMIVLSCKNNSENKEETNIATTVFCSNEVNFGNTPICLPEIKGLVEAYKHPKVKLRADEFETTNFILGYYLDDVTFKVVDHFESVSYDNYYKVYAPKDAADMKMGVAEMKQVSDMMTSGFLDKTMEDLNDSDVFSEKEIKITQPVLVEKYTLNKNSATIILFMRFSDPDGDQLKAISMTSAIIKERLVFMAHYLDYKDEDTVETLKANTKNFMDSFFEANI